MKNSLSLFVLVFLTIAPTWQKPASAESWSQYRGSAGDGTSADKISNSPWGNSGPKVLWKVPTPLGFSSLAVADGHAITIVGKEDREVCLALDADTGKTLWESNLGSLKYGQGGGDSGAPDNRGGDGPRSTPAIDGDRVYAYDAFMTLHCLKASDGTLIWKQDITKDFAGRNIRWRNATCPIIVGDKVIVGGGGAGQSFLAFNKLDGKVVWKSGDETITHATPTLARVGGKQQIVFLTQSGLVSLDVVNGEEALAWRVSIQHLVGGLPRRCRRSSLLLGRLWSRCGAVSNHGTTGSERVVVPGQQADESLEYPDRP